jgi:1-deoxy-D-xylulose-5-phosphate synthase
LILHLVKTHEALITIEEGAVGGFGSHVAQLLSDKGVFDHGYCYRAMVLPDVFLDQASPEEMYASAGLRAADIAEKVREVLAWAGTVQTGPEHAGREFAGWGVRWTGADTGRECAGQG